MLLDVGSALPATQWGLGYKADYSPLATVGSVVKDFSERFGVPYETCTAQYRQNVLCQQQTLTEVSKDPLRVLSIKFEPSVALYIWQSFRKGLWQAVQRPEDVETLWQAAAAVSSSSGCIAAMLADEDAVSVMVDTDPLQVVSADRLMYDPYQSGSIGAKELPDVAAPIKHLLLFAQLLAVLAAAHDQPASGPMLTQMNPVDLPAVIQHQMEVLAAASNLQPLSITMSATQSQPGTQLEGIARQQPVTPLPARRIVLLRSALLFVKLASLTQSVKADYLGHMDPESPAAVRALWQSLQASSESLMLLGKYTDSQAAYDETDEEVQRAQRLTLLLIQHLIPMLRKCVKEPKVFERAVACCHLLGSILTVSTSVHVQPAASELLRLGAMPLLAAMLETNRALSQAVYPVLSHMIHETPAKSIQAEAESLFAQLNGVRHLSNLLCPCFSPDDSACAKAAARVYALPKEDFALGLDNRDQVHYLSRVAAVMNDILQRQPLMQKASADVSSNTPTALQQRLPTPPPAVWRQIETIVLRAMVLLDWVLSTSNPSEQPELDQPNLLEKWGSLLNELEQLFQTLLLPHLLDMQLDMGRVYKEGLHVVLLSQCFLENCFGSLTTAMLQRLAQDTRLVRKHGAADRSTSYALRKDPGACANIYMLLGRGLGADNIELVTALVQALHVCLDDTAICRSLLATPEVIPKYLQMAMLALTDCMPHNLTAWACMGRLCEVAHPLTEPGSQMFMTAASTHFGSVLWCLRSAMQEPLPWSEDLCPGVARLLFNNRHEAILQSEAMIPHQSAFQALLLVLLRQLFSLSNVGGLQRQLMAASIACLGALHTPGSQLQKTKEVFEVLASLFPIHWKLAETHEYSQTNYLLPDASDIRLLDAHLDAVVAHLDSPEKWQCFKQQGLQGCVEVLSATAKKCEVIWRKHPVNACQQVWPDPQPYCDLLIAVLGKHYGLPMPDESKDSAEPGAESSVQQTAGQHAYLQIVRAGCAVVTLVFLWCNRACEAHKMQKVLKQEVFNLQKITVSTARVRSSADQYLKDVTKLNKSREELVVVNASLSKSHEVVGKLLPLFKNMQRQSAWPAVLACNAAADWPGSQNCAFSHDDLSYLITEKVFPQHLAGQEIDQWFSLMLGKKGASASAEGLADQLVAEEAQAAARAASKKAKKQKAKARKLQGQSDALAAALPPADDHAPAEGTEAEEEQLGDNVAAALAAGEPMLEGSSAAAGLAKHDAAALVKPSQAEGMKEQQPVEASSHNADDNFLRNLFRCPLTKVVMVEPVIAADGHTYEKTAIQHWLQGSSLSPVTGDKLPHTRLVPNVLVKSALGQHAYLTSQV